MTIALTQPDALRAAMREFHNAGETVALVPTMGALHLGHMALVKAAKAFANRVVVSIFVNPTQFGPQEDFSNYPRTVSEDRALLVTHGVDVLWLPDVATMYAPGDSTRISVKGVSEGLCGAFRPGHFEGVATVVAKLLLQVSPHTALFGEKDYQQLCVIKRMAEDLCMDVSIKGVPIVREADGLAMSSRNRYLTDDERKIAPKLYALLQKLAHDIKNKEMNEHSFNKLLVSAEEELSESGFTKLDYLECRENDTLLEVRSYQPNSRLLAAVWLGNTRLIDNVEVG